jgi:hypothetical protein
MSERPEPVDAEQVDPEHASSERAGETPPHDDAEQLESALREGGPLGPADDAAEQRRQQPTEEGPGTSLT